MISYGFDFFIILENYLPFAVIYVGTEKVVELNLVLLQKI